MLHGAVFAYVDEGGFVWRYSSAQNARDTVNVSITVVGVRKR